MRSPRQSSAALLAAALIGASAGRAAPARAQEPPAAPAQEGPSLPSSIPVEVAATGIDDRDVLEVIGLRKRSRASQPKRGQLMLFALPVFSVNPSTGFALGLGASGAIALGAPEDTIVSSLSGSLMYTTKQQLMANAKTFLVTSGNEWELLGDLRFYKFSESTYGLGTADTPVSGGFLVNGVDTEGLPGAQPMKFDYVKVHETVFKKVSGPIYLGAGYHLDLHQGIEDELLDLAASPPAVTSHYAYSRLEGFDPTHYTLSGFSVNGLYESRDHTLDPYRGLYLQLTLRVNPTWLGSSRSSSIFSGEFRTYLPVERGRPRHLVALWIRADAVATGAVPYLDLPATGYDTRGRSARGYAAGRFRGTALVAAEAEYRFPLTRSGVLGGVAFVNATTTSRPAVNDPALGVSERGVALFERVVPAGGAGLRLKIDRQARMNLVADYAVGVSGAHGLYLALGEAF